VGLTAKDAPSGFTFDKNLDATARVGKPRRKEKVKRQKAKEKADGA
jgi:hypothetical protein